MPLQAFILALVGALVLAKLVVSWVTFLAETFAFGGTSVRPLSLHLSTRLIPAVGKVIRREKGKMGR
jgi:hypothetical protein